MELVLPELTDLNTYISAERSNRFAGAKIKRSNTDLVAMYARAQSLRPVERINKFTCIWRHKNKKKDFDNVEFGVKWIKDGLVQAGIIGNDGWSHFPPRTLHKHEVDPNNPGVTVILK
jgi:hypothetical protein